ncbi:hypothetical protein QQ045_024616 [Rhodiola kirilowii]
MGNKIVSQSRSKEVSMSYRGQTSTSAALVFSVVDGRLKEFKQRITAGEVVVSNETFLASSECLEVGWHVPRVPLDEVLQATQLYLLLPVSYLLSPLSLHDLCDLAVRAGAALGAKERSRRSRGGVDPSNRCLPISEVSHLVDKVEKLKFTSVSCRK